MGKLKVAFLMPHLGRDNWLNMMEPAALLGEADDLSVCVFTKADRFALSRFDVLWFDSLWSPEGAGILEALRGTVKLIAYVAEHVLGVPFYLPHHEVFGDPRQRDRVAEILGKAHCVVSPTRALTERYREFNPVSRTITPGTWPSVSPPRDAPPGEVRIGWIGHPASGRDLLVLERVLPRIARRYAKIRWFSTAPLPGIRESAALRYEAAGKYEPIARADALDIGLYPLADNDYNRCRYPSEIAEFASAGIPVVASGIGQDAGICVDGSTGLLARDDESWERNIISLVEDAGLRQSLGNAARREAHMRYSLADCAGAFREIIEATARGSAAR